MTKPFRRDYLFRKMENQQKVYLLQEKGELATEMQDKGTEKTKNTPSILKNALKQFFELNFLKKWLLVTGSYLYINH